jgi:hypothetical protein
MGFWFWWLVFAFGMVVVSLLFAFREHVRTEQRWLEVWQAIHELSRRSPFKE